MVTSKELLLTSITHFYDKNPSYKELLKCIIDGRHPVSLRLLDGFITHYAKVNHTLFWIDGVGQIQEQGLASYKKVQVYLEYRAQLKSYTKMYFDPFRRHERISFVVHSKPLVTIETTIGQLNFFRWVFQSHILDYVLAHMETIEESLVKTHAVAGGEKEKQKTKNTITEAKCFLKFD